MPTYKYKCKECNKSFSIKATMAEKDKNSKSQFKCSYCGSTDIIQNYEGIGGFIKGSDSEGNSCSMGNSSCPTGTCPFMNQ